MSTTREWIVLWKWKHKGKTLPQVMFTDPDWFFWAYKDGVFKNEGNLRIEANEIFKKSTSIKISQKGSVKLVAEYSIHPVTQNFCGLEIVPEDRPLHKGSTPVFRQDVIDMSIPKQMQGYDKLGYKIMITAIKFYVLGNTKIRMTKEKCGEFFNNDANFEL